MNLSPSAEKALNEVLIKQTALKTMKDMLEEEFRATLEQKLAPLIKDRNASVKIADELGVPRTKIGQALGTSNYKTVQDILEETGSAGRQMPAVAVAQTTGKPWTLVEVSEGWSLTISGLGAGNVSGSAVVKLEGDEITFVSGDQFVIPQVYRNGLADEVKAQLN